MTKIWYCANCGYEVSSRGRCHQCRQRLVASSLPELPAGEDDDEVGYRLDTWTDRERGRLIEQLNELEILHRFEEDELVVAAEDETRVDDLVAELAANPEADEPDAGSWATAGPAEESTDEDRDEWVGAAVRLLRDAAGRLRRDPTDMLADADVAEASAAVFMVDRFGDADVETWAAVGRVTRRLLSALGADDALEDEIRSQAAVLDKLLTPLALPDDAEAAGLAAAAGPAEPAGGLEEPGPAPAASPASAALAASPASAASPESAALPAPAEVEPAEAALADDESAGAALAADEPAQDEPAEDETVYELPEWLPEQRAELGILLDEALIGYEWDGPDLIVPADREGEVESLFERVGGVGGDEDDDDGGETRYHAIEELFAAADRLAGDPSDEARAADVVMRIKGAVGPPPIGYDEVYWFRIMTQARALSESIGSGRDEQVISDEAAALRDLLRTVV
jgi:hypothetical protein